MMSFYEQLSENGKILSPQNSETLLECQLPESENVLRGSIEENVFDRNDSASISSSHIRNNSSRSTQPEENNLPDIVGWRRAIVEDVPAIKQLQVLSGDTANLLYRAVNNFDEIVENSYLSIVQYNSKDDLVSFTAFDLYPNIPSIKIFWDDWIALNYRFEDVNSRNVLFIHYMLWLPGQENKFLPLLLETVFSEFLYVKHIIIIKPPKATVPEFCKNYFIPILPPALNEVQYNSIQSILLCLRTSIIQPLKIRSAFEYEFDVISSAIKSHYNSTANTDNYCGLDFVNFFYEDKKTLICEFEGQLAGIMTLNLKVDLDFLNEVFELAPFNGLRKKNFLEQNSKLSPSGSKHSPVQIQESPSIIISSGFLFSQLNWEIMLSKKKLNESLSVCTKKKCDTSNQGSSEFSLISLTSFFGRTDSNEDEEKNEFLVNLEKNEVLPKTDIKVAIQTSGISMTHFFPSKHHGQSNAFLIDFWAIDCSKIDEKLSSFDFLEAAFKNVPDRDYCALIIPTNFFPFPLLDLFVRVTPRLMSGTKQELYLCHKKSLSVISMYVKNVEENDLPNIYIFLKCVNEGDAVYNDILNHCFVSNNNFQSFILVSQEKIIGVSLINRDSVEHLRMNFNVTDLSPLEINQTESGSIIRHLIVNPKYHCHTRFFLRDIMRLADVPCLYYVKRKFSKVHCSVTTILGDLCPVKPKKKEQVKGLFWSVKLPTPEEQKFEDPFSLYFMNPRFCGLRKIDVNVVIIVVGASRTSIAFFENLIFGPQSKFISYNNLICVTPHKPEAESEQVDISLMFPIRDCFSREYLCKLSLETYVNFLYGVMTEINRSEKYIVVNNKSKLRYDYLILTCGLQYLPPTPKSKETSKKKCKKNFRSPLARFLLLPSEDKKVHIPKHANNMFIINTRNDAKNAIQALQYLLNEVKPVRQEKKIIVYGHDLHSFLTIQTLLKLGVPGEFIAFVEPFPTQSSGVTIFNDPCVDKAVLEGIKNCKIVHYREYFLYDWSLNLENYISSITFHSHQKQVVIPCLAFIPFLEKLVSDVTFNACNEAGLVYDGRLVINHYFRTNDSYIFAAGPFTKYAKRYYASDCDHRYFNSAEVGEKLAQIIREKISPLTAVKNEENSDLVPKMIAPIVVYCQLPGDYNLFVLRKPGKNLDLETALNSVNYGEVLTTGDCKTDTRNGYFRLHLDPYGFVRSITCYSKNKIDYKNLPSLYGLHEKLLNNLLFRYDMSLIPDFFEYFRQPWALALFHENFKFLRECNIQAFYQTSLGSKNFPEQIARKLQSTKWDLNLHNLKNKLEADYLYSQPEEEIKNNLLQFLKYFSRELPVYALPAQTRRLKLERAEP